MKRYFTTSRKADGYYHVKDRDLESVTIAKCIYKEQASLVCDALNQKDYLGKPIEKRLKMVGPCDPVILGA